MDSGGLQPETRLRVTNGFNFGVTFALGAIVVSLLSCTLLCAVVMAVLFLVGVWR